ncbi:hypothetical protein [Tabrizicola sp.]|uniref:hypothetical protein n=1 Tax=Tabrizicola sp. TaxID=2005166 RepID=UPI00286D12E3|nr:hypothetical protein [Tabrizicola sp.]
MTSEADLDKSVSAASPTTGYWPRGVIFIAFALLLILSFTHNVNWDEFYFLSHVHSYLDGRLDRPMQTFFVHAFGWLDHVPGTEIHQIFAARLVMVALLAGTALCIHRIATLLSDTRSADIAVVLFLCSGFVLPHGASFRADPIAASLLMGALALMMTSRMQVWQIGLVALLSALALLVTIKSALYLPVLLAAMIWRASQREMVLRCLAAGLLALVLAGLLYLWHQAGLEVAPERAVTNDAREAFSRTLLSAGLFPRRNDIALWVLLSIPAILLAVQGLRAAPSRRLRIVLVLFAAPLIAVVVYRNAFPYFFPFAIPPLMIAAAIGVRSLAGQPMVKRLVALALILGVVQAALTLREGNAVQRATIAEVHRLFKTPVPYIDQHSMIASFPQVGFFMSTWGLERYRDAGQPVFKAAIAQAQPPLLIANKWQLAQALSGEASSTRPAVLLPEDQVALQETYVHYSGAIWLAGRNFTAGETPLSFELPINGNYRIVADGNVTIDGRSFVPGDVVALGSAPHQLTALPGSEIKLIWDTGVTPLDDALPNVELYAVFWHL